MYIENATMPLALENTTAVHGHTGRKVILPCLTKGTMFYFEWWYNSQLLLSTNNTLNNRYSHHQHTASLVIYLARRQDNGIYRCTVRNALGYVEKEVRLFVGKTCVCIII